MVHQGREETTQRLSLQAHRNNFVFKRKGNECYFKANVQVLDRLAVVSSCLEIPHAYLMREKFQTHEIFHTRVYTNERFRTHDKFLAMSHLLGTENNTFHRRYIVYSKGIGNESRERITHSALHR